MFLGNNWLWKATSIIQRWQLIAYKIQKILQLSSITVKRFKKNQVFDCKVKKMGSRLSDYLISQGEFPGMTFHATFFIAIGQYLVVFHLIKAVVQLCSIRKIWKVLQKLRENTCTRSSFLMRLNIVGFTNFHRVTAFWRQLLTRGKRQNFYCRFFLIPDIPFNSAVIIVSQIW